MAGGAVRRALGHAGLIVLLTALTQLGGLAWAVALSFRRRVLAFVLAYAVLSLGAIWVAPLFGRVALPCAAPEASLRVQSVLLCAMNRHYVVPELAEVLADHAQAMEVAFPGTRTRVLDANFPFLIGFPLLPHLSHDDGRKADLAFYYTDDTGYLPGLARSPVGYFAFEPGPTDCPPRWPTLRWDLDWLQGLWPAYRLEPDRMRAALTRLSADARIGRIFIEPHLVASLGVASDKIGFQGCRAARHDDHIHIQL